MTPPPALVPPDGGTAKPAKMMKSRLHRDELPVCGFATAAVTLECLGNRREAQVVG